MHIERYRNRHPVYFRPFFSPRVLGGDFGRVFGDLFNEGVKGDEVALTPAVDLVDTADSLQVKVELPGVKKEDVEISLKEDLLTVKGEKKEEREEKEENRYYVERSYGSFSRTVTLPALVKSDEVKAVFKDGILEITLPKDEDDRKKEIRVEVN